MSRRNRGFTPSGALASADASSEEETDDEAELEPVVEPPPKPLNGRIRCRVINCALLHSGQMLEIGDEGDFTAEEIASVKVLEPIEE